MTSPMLPEKCCQSISAMKVCGLSLSSTGGFLSNTVDTGSESSDAAGDESGGTNEPIATQLGDIFLMGFADFPA